MTVSQESKRRVEEAKKQSEETLAEVNMKTETAVKEAKRVEEGAIAASQEALRKAEVVRKASENTLEEALVKAEQAIVRAAEESIPTIVLRKLIASRHFLIFSIMMLVVAVVAAVTLSLGLSYLIR